MGCDAGASALEEEISISCKFILSDNPNYPTNRRKKITVEMAGEGAMRNRKGGKKKKSGE